MGQNGCRRGKCAMIKGKTETNQLTDLRRRAEARQEGEVLVIPEMLPEDVRRLVQELRTHEIALEMQNEELCRIQDELAESREKYSDIYDSAPVGYTTLSGKGLILEANVTLAEMLGVDRGSLVGRRLSGFVVAEDQGVFCQQRLALQETEYEQACQLRMQKEDGSSFRAKMQFVLVDGGNDRELHSQVSIVDITDREQAVEGMPCERWLAEEYTDSLPGLFYVFDEHRFVRWNKEWEKVTGYNAEELAGRYGTDFFEGEDKAFIGEQMLKVFRDGAAEAEAELVTKDGRHIPYYFTGLRKKFNGKDHLVGLGIDITDRKQAEENIKNLAKFPNENPDPVLRVSKDGKVLYSNEAGNLLLAKWGSAIGKTLPEKWRNIIADAIASGKGRKEEVQVEESIFSTIVAVVKEAGYVNLYGRDITERRRAEKSIEEWKNRYRAAVDASGQVLYDWDSVTDEVVYGGSLETVLGYTQEDMAGGLKRWSELIHPDDRRDFGGLIERVLKTGEVAHSTYRVQKKNGEYAHVEDTGQFFQDADGKLVRMVGFVKDITDRKKAEEEHGAYIHFLESLGQVNKEIQQADDVERMLWEVVETTFSIFQCDRAWLLYPCDPDAPTYRIPIEVTRPEYPGAFAEDLDIPMKPGPDKMCAAVLGSEGPLTFGPDCDHSIDDKVALEKFGVQTRMVTGIFPKQGKPWIFGMHQCSHQRVWTAEERRLFAEIGQRIGDGLSSLLFLRDLEKSEEIYRITAEKTGQMLYDYDPGTGNVKWEGAVEAVTGYSKEEFQSFDVDGWASLIHPDDRDVALKALEESHRKCSVYDIEYRFRRKDGDYIIVEEHGTYLADTHGKAYRMLGSMKNITDRKKAEEAVEENKRLLNRVGDIAKIGGWEMDLEKGGRATWTKGTYDIAEISEDEHIPSVDEHVSWYLPEYREMIKKKMHALVESREPMRFEAMLKTRNGNCKWCQAIGEVVEENGKVVKVRGTFQDITDRKEAEEALRVSEEQFRALFDNMSSGVAVYRAVNDGSDFVFVDFNKASEKIENLKREEVIDRSVQDVFPGVGEFGLLDVFKRVCKTGDPEYFPATEYKDERIAGWRDNYVYKLPTGNIVAMYDDITTEKQAEEALRESEKRYRMFVSGFRGIAFSTDLEARPVFVHGAVTEITGYTEDDFTSGEVLWEDIVCPEDLALIHEDRRKLATVADYSCEKEYRITRKDGEERWVQERMHAVYDSDGVPIGVQGVIYDVTEQRKAAARIRLLSEAVKQSSEGIAVTDLEGIVVFANEAFAKMHGYSPEEVIGREISAFRTEEQMGDMGKAFDIMKQAGEFEGEVWHAKRDGKAFPTYVHDFVLRDEAGEVVNYIGTMRDITLLKEEEDRERERQAELMHMARLSTLGEMASSLAHELNQPLCAISSYVGGCKRMIESSGVDCPDVLEGMESAGVQAERAAKIIRRVRGFVRKQEPERRRIDLGEVVREAVSFIEADARRKSVSVECKLPAEGPMVRADVVQIEQVTMNLLRNAIDSMDEVPTDRRHLCVEMSYGQNSQTEVAVSDTGVGLDAELQERVFEAFFTTKPDGMGIGLSISRSIVEAHGGHLWARANPDCGTTFRFSLPLFREE